MDSALFLMISLRVLPGSPNYIYNVILPHVERVGLGPTLISVVIGQAPLNFSWAQAGRVIRQLKSKSDIVSVDTMVGLLLLSIACVLPVLYRVYFTVPEPPTKARKLMDRDSDEEGTQLMLLDEDR